MSGCPIGALVGLPIRAVQRLDVALMSYQLGRGLELLQEAAKTAKIDNFLVLRGTIYAEVVVLLEP